MKIIFWSQNYYNNNKYLETKFKDMFYYKLITKFYYIDVINSKQIYKTKYFDHKLNRKQNCLFQATHKEIILSYLIKNS